ncbi:Putrescine-binding periplasmic protein [Thalictrum thalictroides]|uniref:Putrescine-binding periplasmic protein n=1 Tax=Thalictrum thalictroides TaxID=46969 RepID=A0A7J6XA49_THATH|nr:Putrescine-binding periplasmic protein [Thalictrum thalictroides]
MFGLGWELAFSDFGVNGWAKGLRSLESCVSEPSYSSQVMASSDIFDSRHPKPSPLVHLTASAILLLGLAGFSAQASADISIPKRVPDIRPVSVSHTDDDETQYTAEEQESFVDVDVNVVEPIYSANVESHVMGKSDIVENIEDMELKAALENWKSKSFALTVPLRIVALRGSIPPSWIKDFICSQGRRLKFQCEYRGQLGDIFSDMVSSITKGKLEAGSAMAADIVTVGDSWLNLGIKKRILEPIQDVEEQDWFKGLSEKWKVYLRRNVNGELDPGGKIWAVPYRWGSIVIAYKKNKFRKHNLAPIEDWGDLWRPELAGKISMVESPREVVGAILKYMGASYNTMDIDAQVTGGMKAAMQKFVLLQKQVRLFDDVHYLKAFGVGDVWVAVGWSSDVLPAAKRMSDVAVIVPKSGASLWADLWAIPAAQSYNTNRIGGRVRGPSPLIQQWIEFCLLYARALPFKQEVVPGASPAALENQDPPEVFEHFKKGKPKLETNLIAGVPPPEILDKCEFLEPLPESAMKDYQWLIDGMQKPGHGLIYRMQQSISSLVQHFGLRIYSR